MKQYKCPNCWTKNLENSYNCSKCWKIFWVSKEKYEEYINRNNLSSQINRIGQSSKNNNIKKSAENKNKAEKYIQNAWWYSFIIWILKIIAALLMPFFINSAFNIYNRGYSDIFINLIIWFFFILLWIRIRNSLNSYTRRNLIFLIITLILIIILIGLSWWRPIISTILLVMSIISLNKLRKIKITEKAKKYMIRWWKRIPIAIIMITGLLITISIDLFKPTKPIKSINSYEIQDNFYKNIYYNFEIIFPEWRDQKDWWNTKFILKSFYKDENEIIIGVEWLPNFYTNDKEFFSWYFITDYKTLEEFKSWIKKWFNNINYYWTDVNITEIECWQTDIQWQDSYFCIYEITISTSTIKKTFIIKQYGIWYKNYILTISMSWDKSDKNMEKILNNSLETLKLY